MSTPGTSGYRLSYKLLLRAVQPYLSDGVSFNRGHDMPHIHRWRSTGNTTRSWPRRTPSRVRCLWRSSPLSSHGSSPSRHAMARNTSAGLHERCERIFTQCFIEETQDLCHIINFHNQILFKRSFPLVCLRRWNHSVAGFAGVLSLYTGSARYESFAARAKEYLRGSIAPTSKPGIVCQAPRIACIRYDAPCSQDLVD